MDCYIYAKYYYIYAKGYIYAKDYSTYDNDRCIMSLAVAGIVFPGFPVYCVVVVLILIASKRTRHYSSSTIGKSLILIETITYRTLTF